MNPQTSFLSCSNIVSDCHCSSLSMSIRVEHKYSGRAIAHLNNGGMIGPDVKTSQQSGEVRSRHVYCIIIFRWFQITPHAQMDGTGMSTGMGSLQSAACRWKTETISTGLSLWGHFICEAKSSEPIRHSCKSHLQQYKDNSKTQSLFFFLLFHFLAFIVHFVRRRSVYSLMLYIIYWLLKCSFSR